MFDYTIQPNVVLSTYSWSRKRTTFLIAPFNFVLFVQPICAQRKERATCSFAPFNQVMFFQHTRGQEKGQYF